MADVIAVTDEQQLKLDTLALFGNDTAAAKQALEFIGVSRFNFQLVANQLSLASSEDTQVAKAIKAVALAESALTLLGADS